MSYLDEINKYIDDGDYRKAIEELNIIISKEPYNARAFYMRGKSAFIELKQEEYDDNKYNAKKILIYSTIEYDLNKSIDIDPNIVDAYRGLMYLNRDLKNVDREREYAQILFNKDNKAYDALLILASSYLNNGDNESDFHQAIGYYDDFIKNVSIENSKIARFERVLCYYNLNILDKADIETNKLILDFPMYDDAYFLKGIILAKKGIYSKFYDDALFFFNRALEINPLNYNAIYERAKWYFNKKKYRKAINNYDELLKNNDKYKLDAILGKAQALHDLIIENEDEYYLDSENGKKDLDDAFYLLDNIIDVFNIKNIQYRYYRGNLYVYKGNIKKAILEFKNILKENNYIDSWFYERIAELYYCNAKNDNDYKKALEYLSYIDKKNYKDSTYYILIYSNYELKNYKKIVEICNDLFQSPKILDNNDLDRIYNIRYIYAYSLLMIGSNDYEIIIHNLQKCLNSNLDKTTIYRTIAKIMIYKIANIDEGIYILKKAIELNDALSYLIYAKELFYGDIIIPYPELSIEMSNIAFHIDNTLENSLNLIGRGYELGRGVEKDEHKAFEFYYKANEIANINNSNYSTSKGLIAHCYYNGIGIEKDENIAIKIVKDSAKNDMFHDYVALLYSYFALIKSNSSTLFKAKYEYNNAT